MLKMKRNQISWNVRNAVLLCSLLSMAVCWHSVSRADDGTPETGPDNVQATPDQSPIPLQIHVVGGEKAMPLGGIKVSIWPGTSLNQVWEEKPQAWAETNTKGIARTRLLPGRYVFDVSCRRELPYLHQSGRFQVSESNTPTELKIQLSDPCQLTLRALDIDSGEGVAGVTFAKERPYDEHWAEGVASNTLGKTKYNLQHQVPLKGRLFETDKTGTYRVQTAERIPWWYSVWTMPKGYTVAGIDDARLETKPGTVLSHTFWLRKKATKPRFTDLQKPTAVETDNLPAPVDQPRTVYLGAQVDDMPGFDGQTVSFQFYPGANGTVSDEQIQLYHRIVRHGRLVRAHLRDQIAYFKKAEKDPAELDQMNDVRVYIEQGSSEQWRLTFALKNGLIERYAIDAFGLSYFELTVDFRHQASDKLYSDLRR